VTTKHRSFSCTRSRHRFCAFFARLSSFGTTGFQEGSWEQLGGVHLRKVGWEGESSMVFWDKKSRVWNINVTKCGDFVQVFRNIYSSRTDWRVDLHDTHLNTSRDRPPWDPRQHWQIFCVLHCWCQLLFQLLGCIHQQICKGINLGLAHQEWTGMAKDGKKCFMIMWVSQWFRFLFKSPVNHLVRLEASIHKHFNSCFELLLENLWFPGFSEKAKMCFK